MIAAREAAIDEAAVELNINEVTGFGVAPKNDDKIGVSFLLPTGTFKLDCHFHGDEMACHVEGDEHEDEQLNKDKNFSFTKDLDRKDPIAGTDFRYLMEGHDAGLGKLEKTLRRKGMDLDALKTIKVWKRKGNGSEDGHEHSDDIWTKVTYDLNNNEVTVFIQCHKHKGEENFFCHYKKAGKSEPML